MGQKGWLAPGKGNHARGAGLIQNGPRTAALASDPRDTTGVAVCEGTAWGGAVLPLQHPLKTHRLVQLCRRHRGPSPELVPLVPLSVLVLLGSWVLQVRDIGKVILFRKP